jgi:hypothetical protein
MIYKQGASIERDFFFIPERIKNNLHTQPHKWIDNFRKLKHIPNNQPATETPINLPIPNVTAAAARPNNT